MFDNFVLSSGRVKICGYRFKCDNPAHVVCIIHGIGEYAKRYNRLAEKLAEKGIACVALDLPGHGISTGVRGDASPREEVLGHIDDLIRYASKEYPGLPITLYGHSMGGNICLDYKARGTLNHVPEKYIVSAPWIRLVRKVPKPLYYAVKAMSRVFPKKTISSSCDETDLGNPKYVRPYKSDSLVHDKISLRCAVEGFDIGESIAKGTHVDNHRSDGKPFLLMHGDMDKICDIDGSRQLAKQLEGDSNFIYMEWPGHYHEIINGGRDITGDDVIAAIINFVLG